MSSTSLPTTYPAAEKVTWRRLAWAGLLTVVAAFAANLLLRALVAAVMPLDPAFMPLTPGPIAIFTFIGTTLSVLVFALIVRRSTRPVRTFRTVAIITLVISILPNLGLAANPAASPFPGGSTLNFGTLILFHILAAVVCIVLLPNLTRKR